MPPEENDNDADCLIPPSNVDHARNSIQTELLSVDEIVERCEKEVGVDAASELLEFCVSKKRPQNYSELLLKHLRGKRDMMSRICADQLVERIQLND